jgi:hypothetical protein
VGRLIQFPIARVRRSRRHSAVAFDAFGELAMLERAQMKLFALCACCAIIVTGALQLAAG